MNTSRWRLKKIKSDQIRSNQKQRMASLFRNSLVMMLMIICATQVNALGPGEVSTLKDMQAEWGTQLGWTGSPSCNWTGVSCNTEGNVIELYVPHQLFLLLFLFISPTQQY